MSRFAGLFFCLCLGISLLACSSSPPGPDQQGGFQPEPASSPEKVVWSHMPGGLQLSIVAQPDANLAGGQPHAVSLCIIQAKAREALVNLAGTAQGITELLQCKPKPELIVSARSFFIQPGEEKFIVADRSEGANILAVVAGFDELVPENCFRIMPMSIHQDSYRSGLLLEKHYTYSAAPMDVSIDIGQSSIAVKGVESGG